LLASPASEPDREGAFLLQGRPDLKGKKMPAGQDPGKGFQQNKLLFAGEIMSFMIWRRNVGPGRVFWIIAYDTE
jgi:hypothetical protein